MGGCRTVGPLAYEKPGEWRRRLAPKPRFPFSVLGLSQCYIICRQPNVESVKNLLFHIFLRDREKQEELWSSFFHCPETICKKNSKVCYLKVVMPNVYQNSPLLLSPCQKYSGSSDSKMFRPVFSLSRVSIIFLCCSSCFFYKGEVRTLYSIQVFLLVCVVTQPLWGSLSQHSGCGTGGSVGWQRWAA